MSFEDLVNHIDQPGIAADPSRDITKIKPDISEAEALAVQLAVKRRWAANGDRIMGHQASFTSPGLRKVFPDSPYPMVGTFMRSMTFNDGDEVELVTGGYRIESELGVILGRDLEGPDLTEAEVLAATDCFLPTIEVAPRRPGMMERAYSWPHMIAVQKAIDGYMVLGKRMTPSRGIDVSMEGCTVSIGGEHKGSAVACDAMGSPLKVVAAIAAKLHEIGEKLHAGQIIMTGSIPESFDIAPQDRVATVNFTTLGSVSVRVR